MKKLLAPIAGAGLFLVLAAGAVAAASPAPTAPGVSVRAVTSAPSTAPAATTGTIAGILGLTDAELTALRQQGLSLAQIAARQNVAPQKLIDALVAQWSIRIDARLVAGAITADQATTLKANLAVQAKAMVNRTTLGGMRGGAVGAGPNGTMRGAGAGTGLGANGMAGAGRGGMMRGARAGTAACPMATATPSS